MTRDRSLLTKLLALLAVLSLVAAACGDDNGVADPTDPNGDVEEGGEIVVAATQEITSFNTNTSAHNLFWGAQIVQQMWPSPGRATPDFEIEWTLLEEAPEVVSEDPFTVEWRIREEAAWDDGTPVSFDDFEYYWRACNGRVDEGEPSVVDEETGEETTGIDCAATAGYELIESMESENDGKLVRAVFSDVYVDYEGLFGTMPPSHIAYDSDDPWEFWNTGFNDEPFASAGPWRFEEWNRGNYLILVRNENYWGEPAKLDRIIFRFVDEDAAPDALRNREVNVISPQPQIDLVQQVEGFDGVSHSIKAGPTFEHLTFNLRNQFLAMPEVREALALALDRQEIVDALIGPFDPDLEPLGNRIFVANQPEYVDNTPAGLGEGDVEAARQRLEDAGFTEGPGGVYQLDGQPLALRISTTGGNPRRERAQELIIDQLGQAGFDITVRNLPGSDAFDLFFPPGGEEPDFEIALFAWVGTLFPTSGVPQIYGTGSGSNAGAYSNEQVDALAEEALRTVDADERNDILNQIDAILWEDLPTIPLYQLPSFLAWSDDYTGLDDNPTTAGFTWNTEEWARRAR